MARSKQTAQPDGDRSVLHKKTFVDHGGQPATRVRYGTSESSLPDNFQDQPVFCFQVYTTIPLEAPDDGDGPSTKRTKTSQSADGSVSANLEQLIAYLGYDLSDSQRPSPVYEVYVPQADALACVEHQRREIAHRKSHRSNPETYLIPKVSKGLAHDHRRSGFALVITSESYHDQIHQLPRDHVDSKGPLWIWFDRRFPCATSVEPSQRFEIDPDALGLDPDEVKILPEKMEIECQRTQRTATMQYRLSQILFQSFSPGEGKPEDLMTLALEEDEGSSDAKASEDTLEALGSMASQLSLESFSVDQSGQKVLITNCTAPGEPDLRYIVYAAFLDQPGMEEHTLEQVGSAFTSAIVSRLSRSKTVSFSFHKPDKPTWSSVLSGHKKISESKPEDYFGALYQYPQDDAPTRIYPCTRQEMLPTDCAFESYKTFIIVLDKPDFADAAGVLFLLEDGGKQKQKLGDEHGFFGGPTFDYDDMLVLRSAGMNEVAKRLAMDISQGEEENLEGEDEGST